MLKIQSANPNPLRATQAFRYTENLDILLQPLSKRLHSLCVLREVSEPAMKEKSPKRRRKVVF